MAWNNQRAAATNMVKGGASIKVVADVLGHEDASTTMRYLGLDVETLRGACSPWPGGGAS
ncbi:MAG: tyrosine-type recombinase/integrase [Atopobiaceae bacterium]|nr:tyrosine-type recombinase/integrase [Atopobiaceae bacterium]